MARRRGRRGDGSVYWDKHARRWVANVSIGVRDGRRIRRKVTTDDPDSARLELARLQRIYGRAGDTALLPLGAYLEDWLAGIRPSIRASTATSYEGHIRLHIVPLLGNVTTAALRPSDVRRLISERLGAGLKPATVQRIVTTLRMALASAVREGDLERNVAQVELPRVERAPIEAMTPERAEVILDAVKGDRLEALWVLLLGTGMRAGEACALDWRDVDLRRGSVFIRQGKTPAARRTIPLPPFVVTALKEHRKASPRVGPSEPVFLGERRSERLRVDVATHAWKALLTATGLPKMRLHDLRHATATLLLQRGVSMRVISEVLGHASPSVTANVYAHVSEASKREAMQGLFDTPQAPGQAPGTPVSRS